MRLLFFFAAALPVVCAQPIPHLTRHGTATQLVVDGKPFLILGGELQNSSASSLAYMDPIWPKLASMHLNTVLTPVSWELVEPAEGKFDWSLVDGLIAGARRNQLRLVVLWFGSWKNTYSSYVPAWVKNDPSRFTRAKKLDGSSLERLTPFCVACRDADARAFAALMRHLRQVDSDHRTVLMVQVENEVGSILEARDHSPEAEARFREAVPADLLRYMTANRTSLAPELHALWDAAGAKESGNWEQVFGNGPAADEFFMAWHFARYIEEVAQAGKGEYPLPMFANAALIRPNYVPGQYNSGGPLPRSWDIWRAGAPSLDFLAPDIYFDTYSEWLGKYDQPGYAVFVPEARGGAAGAANAFYTFGRHHAIGFSPFGIDSQDPETTPLRPAYEVLSQLSPLILEHQGDGLLTGVVLEAEGPRAEVRLGEFVLRVSWSSSAPQPPGAALFISTGPSEFYAASSGNLTVTFAAASPGPPIAGIESIDEGMFANGRWMPGRRLNGDENAQGQVLKLPPNKPGGNNIYRIRLYRYP